MVKCSLCQNTIFEKNFLRFMEDKNKPLCSICAEHINILIVSDESDELAVAKTYVNNLIHAADEEKISVMEEIFSSVKKMRKMRKDNENIDSGIEKNYSLVIFGRGTKIWLWVCIIRYCLQIGILLNAFWIKTEQNAFPAAIIIVIANFVFYIMLLRNKTRLAFYIIAVLGLMVCLMGVASKQDDIYKFSLIFELIFPLFTFISIHRYWKAMAFSKVSK